MKRMSGSRADNQSSRLLVRFLTMVKDYSEYSSIQGIIYIFQSGQSIIGRIFWIFVVLLMLCLSAHMSWQVKQCYLKVPFGSAIRHCCWEVPLGGAIWGTLAVLLGRAIEQCY